MLLDLYLTTRYSIPEDSTIYGSMATLQCWSFLVLSALTSSTSERRNLFLFVAFISCVPVRVRACVRVRINRLEADGSPRFQTGKENVCLLILNTECF